MSHLFGYRFHVVRDSTPDYPEGSLGNGELSKERQDILDVIRSADNPPTPKQVAGALDKSDDKGREAVKALMWKMKKDGQLSSNGGRYSAT